jgi:2-methylisocitrate lyase-like PEP mutase family enzyme
MTTQSSGARLRELMGAGNLIVAPGVYDGISATVVGRLRFDAGYLTGAGIAAAQFGLPDVGLVTQTEMVERVRVLSGLLGAIPLIADADTGYGAPTNVIRTVREFERAGAGAIQLEDQGFPKKCGHLADKEVIEVDEFISRLRAALDARLSEDTVIIARTDARAPLGLGEAIRRANLYASAGADVIFVEAPESLDEIRAIGQEVSAPLLINMVQGGLTPDLAATELWDLGYRIAIHPGASLAPATIATLGQLAKLRGVDAGLSGGAGPEDFFRLFGLDEWQDLGDRYDHTKPHALAGQEA